MYTKIIDICFGDKKFVAKGRIIPDPECTYIYIYTMLSSIDMRTLGRMYPPISTGFDVSLATNGETV